MKNPLKLIGAAALASATLFAGPGATSATASSASYVYYVEFYLGNTQVGFGQVGCQDEPFEYLLIWGSDQGEMVVIGRDQCSGLPPLP
jgi:hypothetical protein